MNYMSVIETQGIKIPFDPRIITPKIERPMRNNRYEAGEVSSLKELLEPGDRVLEFGAGVGLCSTVAALNPEVERVVTIEANPTMIPVIRETYDLNGVVDRVDLRNGVVSTQSGEDIPFYVRRDFWASSMEPDSRAYERVEQVPAVSIHDLMAEIKPTVILCDIEGAELGLFDEADLSSVRKLILELHPKVYGDEGVAQIDAALRSRGFQRAEGNVVGSSVQIFEKMSAASKVLAEAQAAAVPAQWYPTNPKVLITTCMKDEGPFILEWLAWHRALGVTDFVVFTNHCSDGTDAMLDHLQARGELTHLPNPALAVERTSYQPVALSYTQHLPQFKNADFVISMDVDEFLNIRVGEGRLTDLFDAAGEFDALSVSELNHGSNGKLAFEPGFVREQFPGHESERPGKHRARKGVKTISRVSDRLARLRNHRPNLVQDQQTRWLDGSGKVLKELHQDETANGLDARGRYGLVVLDHYPLRSLESFFMKTVRGDVVAANKQVSLRYWRFRNRAGEFTSKANPVQEAAAREYYEQTYASDPELMSLHARACAWHTEKIREISEMAEFKERRAWIMENAWEE